jgi:hypothetical protein
MSSQVCVYSLVKYALSLSRGPAISVAFVGTNQSHCRTANRAQTKFGDLSRSHKPTTNNGPRSPANLCANRATVRPVLINESPDTCAHVTASTNPGGYTPVGRASELGA